MAPRQTTESQTESRTPCRPAHGASSRRAASMTSSPGRCSASCAYAADKAASRADFTSTTRASRSDHHAALLRIQKASRTVRVQAALTLERFS